MAQSVAHLIGSEEVTGSIPVNSLKALDFSRAFLFLFPLYDSKVFATLVSELIIVQLKRSTDSIIITFALFLLLLQLPHPDISNVHEYNY